MLLKSKQTLISWKWLGAPWFGVSAPGPVGHYMVTLFFPMHPVVGKHFRSNFGFCFVSSVSYSPLVVFPLCSHFLSLVHMIHLLHLVHLVI
jgi:hypothetical protein